MARWGKLSYQRLSKVEELDEEKVKREVKNARAWLKFRALAGRRRRRLHIPGLRKFLRKRRKFLSKYRVSWSKALNKLKNGKGHLNDLFVGNFLLMQGNSMHFGCVQKPSMGYGLHGLPAKR